MTEWSDDDVRWSADGSPPVKVVFAAIPAYGHVYPLLPLALACQHEGHEVVMATAEPFLDRLPVDTWRSHDAEMNLGWSVAETRRRHPDLVGRDLSVAMFADNAAEVVSASLLGGLVELEADLVVYEAMNVGAGVAADVLGIPAVAFSIGLSDVVPGIIHRAAVGYLGGRWTERGRQPPRTELLARALLDPVPPTLRREAHEEGVPRLPIRSVAYAAPDGVVPSWLGAPSGRPRIYLTLGTVSFGAVEVLRRALDDLAPLEVDLLVALGPEGDLGALGPVPDNVHVETFVAQSEILGLVDLVVHHGGTGTCLAALAAGLPQLILPQGADQFYNAVTLSGAGAARALRNDEQHPGAISAAVSEMLASGRERLMAIRLSREIAAQPGPEAVVGELEHLARS